MWIEIQNNNSTNIFFHKNPTVEVIETDLILFDLYYYYYHNVILYQKHKQTN